MNEELWTILSRDHRAARGLLEQILDTIDDDPEGARLLLEQARIQILSHAQAEERTLYIALDADQRTTDLSHEARAEHEVVEDLLAELTAARVVDDSYKAKVKVMADLLDDHVDDEERLMFPAASRALGRTRLAELADEFIAEKSRALFRLGDDAAADRLLGENHNVVLGVD